jgi:acyl-CoA thioesterase FadM
MTTDTQPVQIKHLLTQTTAASLRPRYEGSNICTWIGFKHVNYLIEEAVLEHFRAAGLPARVLFEEHGLGLDLVDLDTRILHALHMDDLVDAEVVPDTKDGDAVLCVRVTLTLERGGQRLKAATSKVKVSLRPTGYLEAPGEPPADLAPYTVPRLGAHLPSAEPGDRVDPADTTALALGRGTSAGDPVLERLTAGKNAFGWKWRIPYPYCHFTERLQMSGYLRQMEEVVDLFLADRGISIKTLLADRRWIPVVPHSRIQILDEALMEEDLYTIYTVEDVFKDFTYTSRMDCYVVRDGHLVKTATGRITHGYAVIENRRDWSLVEFDEPVLRALRSPAA